MTKQALSSVDDSKQLSGSRDASRGWLRSICARIGLLRLCGMFVFLIIIGGLCLLNHYWPYRYRQVEPLLQNVLASQIKIARYHRIYFPHPGFIADDLTLRRNSAPDLPPVGSARHVVVLGRWIDLLTLHRNVHLVYIEGLHIVIPPVGSRANKEDFPPGSTADFAGPGTMVQQLNIKDAVLDIMRVNGDRYSFPIHQLIIRNLHKGQAVPYFVDMQNARPIGHICATGSFGPLVAGKLGSTPVSGSYTFAPVDMGTIPGIGGTLSASGHFRGPLGGVQVDAHGDIPDFAVGKGRPTHVIGGAQGTVNGLNGDITLNSIDVHTGVTTVHAQGTIAGRPKAVNLDLAVVDGRAQDILRPFVHGDTPIVGAVRLHGHAFLAPSQKNATFFQRLLVNGAFDVPAERLTNVAAEQKLSAFSQRAQGLKSPKPRTSDVSMSKDAAADAHSSTSQKGDPMGNGKTDPKADPKPVPDVLSNLGGGVRIRDGIAYVERLRFHMAGAWVDLHGTFNLRDHTVHLLGDLHMDSDISHVTTGFTSLLLKPLAPFFKKDSAGAVVPIAITGSSGQYKVSSNLLHHK
jgi:hypothetical protein